MHVEARGLLEVSFLKILSTMALFSRWCLTGVELTKQF